MLKPTVKTKIDLFIPVPETTLPGGLVVPAFQVGMYPTSKSDAGKAAIIAEGTPWHNINFEAAKQAATDAGYSLITESQYLALAYQIAAQPENWTGGAVGKGKLHQGLRKWNVKSAQPGTYTPEDADERRYFTLPDGQKVYDIAGNIYSWVFDDIQGNETGVCSKPFADDSPSIVYPHPGEPKGQGWVPARGTNWSGHALLRGGFWLSYAYAGVFRLVSDWPVYEDGVVGFRCTKPGL